MTECSARASTLLAETREELAKADSKANLLLTAGSIAVSALLAGLIAGDLDLARSTGAVQLLSLLAAAGYGAALYLVGRAVFPNTRSSRVEAGRARWFTEIAQYEGVPELTDALDREESENDREKEQLLALSKIALRKYQRIQRAQVAFGATLLLTMVAVALDAATR